MFHSYYGFNWLCLLQQETISGIESFANWAVLSTMHGARQKLRPFPTVTSERLALSLHDLGVVPRPRVYADLCPVSVRGE